VSVRDGGAAVRREKGYRMMGNKRVEASTGAKRVQ
jgi:hypothetical protein